MGEPSTLLAGTTLSMVSNACVNPSAYASTWSEASASSSRIKYQDTKPTWAFKRGSIIAP
jgi:hypothetical protein